MKLEALEVEDFRGFAGSHSFDLAPGVLILAGPNGQGKTSLLDAILWSIVGSVPRLNASNRDIVSVYSETGRARVALTIRSDESELQVIRSTDGEEQKVDLRMAGGTYEGAEAQGILVRKLWPEAQGTSKPTETLAGALTRSVYLQQDVVRQFLEAEDQVQFETFAELVGVGRVTDLQEELEKAKKSWTQATNRRKRGEEEDVRDQLSELIDEKERLESLAEDHEPIEEGEWDAWWTQAANLGLSVDDLPAADSLEAASELEGALDTLEANRRAIERRLERGRQLLTEVQERSSADELPDVSQHERHVEDLKGQLQEQKDRLEAARAEAAAERRQLVEIQEEKEELGSLAQLALRHLDQKCPVCMQDIDEEKTRAHLQDLIEDAEEEQSRDRGDLGGPVEELASSVEKLENKLSEAQDELKSAEEEYREYMEWIAERNQRLSDLGIHLSEDTDISLVLREFITDSEGRNESLSSLEKHGEALSLKLATAREVARREEVRQQITEAKDRLLELESWREERIQTGEYGQRIIEALRGASSTIVKEKLSDLQPLLQSIFARIDAHPTFRETEFHTDMYMGRGRLRPSLRDPIRKDREIPLPTKVLSSSQANSLAVSIFLAFNLGMPAVPLETVILDDPIQSLDDVNLLGLVDLLRRLETQRQLVVSTHNERLAQLLKRKLRPSKEEERTSIIRFSGWSRSGPDVEQVEVHQEEPFSIVA